MACSNCTTNTPYTFDVQYFYSNQCSDCTSADCPNPVNSKCVYYAGPSLNCSAIATNDSLETALQKIDEQICFISGDYSNYQLNCLTDWYGSPITMESQFVNAITGYACEVTTNFNSFIDEAFPDYEDTVNNRFLSIEHPSITCSSAGVSSSDTLFQVLTKYCTKFSSIDTFNSLSGVTWNSCYTIGTTPTSLSTAFNVILNQICQTKALVTSVTLPTFNNSGSCLAGGTSSDGLATTITLIKTKLCSTPDFNLADVAWGCLDDGADDFQSGFQTVVNQLSVLSQNIPTFDSGDFVVTQNDVGDACAGITVSLATPVNQDRFVASDDDDDSPGTLEDKLTAGDGISLDFDTTPGQVIISSDGEADDHLVLADNLDDTPGYLDDKIEGQDGNYGISIATVYNAGTKKVDVTPAVDLDALTDAILTLIETNSVFKERFCTLMNTCPSPCAPPSNVQISQITTTTTTTSP